MPLESKWAKEAEKLPPPTHSNSSKQVQRLIDSIDEPLATPKPASSHAKSHQNQDARAPVKQETKSVQIQEIGQKPAGLSDSKWAKSSTSSQGPTEKSLNAAPSKRRNSKHASTQSHRTETHRSRSFNADTHRADTHKGEPKAQVMDLADQIRAFHTGPKQYNSKPAQRRPGNNQTKSHTAVASSINSSESSQKPASFAAWEDLFDPDESSWAEAEEDYVFSSAR